MIDMLLRERYLASFEEDATDLTRLMEAMSDAGYNDELFTIVTNPELLNSMLGELGFSLFEGAMY